MIKTTSSFVDAVYAPTRTSHSKVNFEIFDVEALDDASLTFSGSANISRTAQVLDTNRTPSAKYASFENNLFKLDGSYKVPPKSTDTENLEVGWWSNVISGADGAFTTAPTLTINFSSVHTSYGITLSFADEIVSDFSVAYYNSSYALIKTTTITGNTQRVVSTNEGADNYKRIIITFTKTANPYRRVRLIEVDFGLIKSYEDTNIINLNVSERMNSTSNDVTSNELRFTLDNSEKLFNVTNPSGFYAYLQQQQVVTAELGIELADETTEYIPVGKYYLKEWTSDAGALTASFTARDILDRLSNIAAPTGVSGTLYALAVGIMTAAGVKSYNIDSALSSFSSAGFTDNIDCRSALQMIGIASKAAVYQDRYGVLQVKQFSSIGDLPNDVNYAGQYYAGEFSVETDLNYKAKRIDLENSFEVPQIKMVDAVKTVEIVTYSGGNQTVYSYTNTEVTKGATIRLENILINSQAHANIIAAWLIEDANTRLLYEANWRQNPAFECGDNIVIEDGFNQIRACRILSQEFSYSGYLNGKTQTKGGV